MPADLRGRLDVFDRMKDVPRVWDEVTEEGGCLGLSRPFLRLVEEHSRAERAPRYLVYRSPGGGLALAAGEVFGPSPYNPILDVLLGRLAWIFPHAVRRTLPFLALRAAVSSDCPIRVLAPSGDRRAVLAEVLPEIVEYADREGLSLAVDGVPSQDRELVDALSAAGFLRTLGRPIAELPLGFATWEEFLAFGKRRSRKAIASIRSEEKRASEAGIVFTEWDPAEVDESELHELLDAHVQRLNDRPLSLGQGFLSAFMRAMEGRGQVRLAMHEGKVKGLMVTARHGDREYSLYPGLVEKEDRSGFLYFNLCYYQLIRRAIDRGLTSVAYGNAAYQAKIRRGCTITMTELFVRPRSALARAISRGPFVLHRKLLARKYAWLRSAPPFSFPRK